jgi:uncharacterized membrane protein
MPSLQNRLEHWVNAGLISGEQAQAIGAYEAAAQVDAPRKPKALYALVAIGVAAIAIGIISLIAANWEEIPATAKLMAYFIGHGAIGYGVYRFWSRPGPWREALVAGFALAFFAGIGLTAQVFHLQSDGWRGLLLWCLLALPMALLAHVRVMAYLWVYVFLHASTVWYVAGQSLWNESQEVNRACLLMFLVHGLFAIGVFRRDRALLPGRLPEALTILPLILIVAGGLIFGTVIWYTGGASVISDLGENGLFAWRFETTLWAGAALSAAALYGRRPALPGRAWLYSALLFLGLAAFITMPMFLGLEKNKVVGTGLSLGLLWIAALASLHLERKGLFDAITLVILLRLLSVYFEVFGSLFATGLGLILSGALVLAGAYVWYRYRGALAVWMKST